MTWFPLLVIIILMASITYLTTPQYLNEGLTEPNFDLSAGLTGENKVKYDNAFEACSFFLTNIVEQLNKRNVKADELETIMNELINELPQKMFVLEGDVLVDALDDDTYIQEFIKGNKYFRNDSILEDNAIKYYQSFRTLIYTYLRIIDPPVNEQEFRATEKSLHALITQYKKTIATNLKNYKVDNQKLMRADEDIITSLLTDLHSTSKKMYPKGASFQQQIMDNNAAFNASLGLAEPVKAKFLDEELKVKSAMGEYESASTQNKAYRVRDYFYGLLAFVAIITVIYSLSNEDPNKAEYIILAMAVLVLIAQVYRKMAEFLADKTSDGLTKLGSLIGKAFYN